MKKIYSLILILSMCITILSPKVLAQEYDKVAHQQFVNSILPNILIKRTFSKFEAKELKNYAAYTFTIENKTNYDFTIKDIIITNIYDKEEVVNDLSAQKEQNNTAIEELKNKIPELKNLQTAFKAGTSVSGTALSSKNPTAYNTKPIIRIIIAKKDGEVVDINFWN